MALRDQPYLPLYVQDFLTDEKLIECSAATTGVYIRIMCLMHKSEEYGTILLKQKYKQSEKQSLNFASQLAKSLPYNLLEIESAIIELLREKVLDLNGDLLVQKRMMKDNEISIKRSISGSKGGLTTQTNNKKPIKKFAKAKNKAKHEYENEIENKDEVVNENNGIEKPKKEIVKYGQFKNVILSEVEYAKAKEKYKEDLEPMIEKLSSYIQSSGKTYKSHYATFSSWVHNSIIEEKQKKQKNAGRETSKDYIKRVGGELDDIFKRKEQTGNYFGIDLSGERQHSNDDSGYSDFVDVSKR